MKLQQIDIRLIQFFKRISMPVARVGLFVIFFWFGSLKVLSLSPATSLVQTLFEQTVSFIPFASFIILFGLFEMLIGVLFLLKGYERIVIPLLFMHMIATFLPLFLLPALTWSQSMVPTLEGQYIIKNLVVIATAIGIASNLRPLSKAYAT